MAGKMKPTKPAASPSAPRTSHETASALSEPTTSTDWIGEGLRQLYQRVAEEPLPDAFATLLDRLDETAPPASAGDRAEPDDRESK